MNFIKNKIKKSKVKNLFSPEFKKNFKFKFTSEKVFELEHQVKILEKKNKILEKKLELNQEELTVYINKIFEQQEKERILNSIIKSVRKSLDLQNVLEKASDEIRKLMNYDRIVIALHNEDESFTIYNEAVCNKRLEKVFLNYYKNFHLNPVAYNKMKFNKKILLSKDVVFSQEDEKVLNILRLANISKYMLVPIFLQNELLGIMLVAGDDINFISSEIEILEDFASQIGVAIYHAKLYSEAQKHIKLKSEFIASMSHELRTPLNAIIGFSDILLVSPQDMTEKQIGYLNNISISGMHLLRLINDILDLSKVESGNCDINYEDFNHNMVVKEVIMVLEGVAKKKNLLIEFDLCEKIIRADSRIFRQIMYNLLSNSIKFTPKDGKIFVKSLIKNNYLFIEVQDNGIGISKKDSGKIFEKFSQADASYTKKQEGTGLGLTLVKKFVNLHGGQVGFDSLKNSGSKFWFTIPILQKEL